ncbi:MAG: dTDP-4-dehydro-6-deoxyglucose aminotransferase [Pirellulaceae bacterium]|nr:dTDP-4-dehydro-6-deoxyglucose aminotransferase [Pirellulaceae bacterium]
MSRMIPTNNFNDPAEPDRILHVGAPNIGDRETFDRLVDEIFERRWFTNSGAVVKEFESKLCDYLGVKHCITVCNATIGLQLVCRALHLTGEVILPAWTFVATAHAVQWEGLQPVFADVDLRTHTINPKQAETLITDKTSAILGVHLWGNPCDTARLQQIADDHDLRIFYDAAHAFGCGHRNRMVGNFGDCEVFSFHATKFFNTFEGGAIATNDDDLAQKLSLMKNFGFESMDRVVHLGTNAKMNEVSAAMGLSMFARLEQTLSDNRRNYDRYRKQLGNLSGLRVFAYDPTAETNWQYVVLEIDQSAFGASRDTVMQYLHDNGVRARRYFYPGCHNMEPYRSGQTGPLHDLQNTESLSGKVLCLPTGSAITVADVDRVCRLIKQSVGSKPKGILRVAG